MHYSTARRALRLGLDHAAEAGERRNLAKLLNTMDWLHGELGDVEQARRWDEQALEASRQGADVWALEAERYSLLNLATDALGAGNVAAAEARLAEVEPLLDRSQYSRFRYLNRYQLLRGEVALARAEPALVIVSLLLLIFLALLFSEAGVLSEAVESGAPVSPTATLQERR